MITSESISLIQKLHEHPAVGVFVATGGGAGFIGSLLAVPGASDTVLEGLIPYSTSSLDDFLGFAPTQYCAKETAIIAAKRAFERAKLLTVNNQTLKVYGLAITASLVSKSPKKGEHRAFLAIIDSEKISVSQITLAKNARTRIQEEELLTNIMLDQLAKFYSLGTCHYSLLTEDQVYQETYPFSPLLDQLYERKYQSIWYQQDHGFSTAELVKPKGILSGAFNPLHAGHEQLRLTAQQYLKGEVIYEMPIIHADKPALAPTELIIRLPQFMKSHVAITDVPLFVDKAKLFPETCFVIGMDTAMRLLNPQFYADSVKNLETALAIIRDQGCYFLVAARKFDGRLHTKQDLKLNSALLDIFQEIPMQDFLMDISSTQIRNSQTRL